MKTINCAVFSEEIARETGKRESESDLEFYHRKHNETMITLIYPRGFPQKINPLMQALYLSDFVLLNVEKIDAELGEKIIAIEAIGKQRGFLVLGEEVDRGRLSQVIKGTVVEGFREIKRDKILEILAEQETSKKEGKSVIDLDAMFNVRGVGVVALGFIKQGIVKKFGKLKLFPDGKEVLVKSIQVHDKERENAECGERVGLALKGIEPKGFSRGMVLTDSEEFMEARQFEIEFKKNKHYPGELIHNKGFHLQCRGQVVGCSLKSLEPLFVETSRKIAARKGEGITLLDINSKPRVAGKGRIIKISLNT